MSLPNYHQQAKQTDHPISKLQSDQRIQTYVKNFLRDAETDDRESVIKIEENDPQIRVNENEAVQTKSMSDRQNRRFNQPSKRRTRIKYSAEQLAILEDEYRRSKFMNVADRDRLAEQMNLDSKHLKLWWRNRRQKEKYQSNKPTESFRGPKKKPNVSQSTSSAPTPSPTPSNFSASCSMDQWQPPINQPIDTQLYNQWPPHQDPYLVPYQHGPVQFHSFPHIDPTWFTMMQQMAPYPYAYPQLNGMDMAYNTTHQNVGPPQYYYEQNSAANGHFPYPSDPSTQFTQLHQQIKLEPLDFTPTNQFDDATTDAATNGLLEYLREMKYEFSDDILLNL